MKIRAEMRFKNAVFYNCRMGLGLSQTALANLLGITNGAVNAYENMRAMPCAEIADIISELFGVGKDVLFSGQSKLVHMKRYGFIKPKYVREFNSELLLEDHLDEVKGYLPVFDNLESEDLNSEIEKALSTLTKREAECLKRYFGVLGYDQQTLEEIGEEFNITRERTRQIKEKALRRLKHTSRSYVLRQFL